MPHRYVISDIDAPRLPCLTSDRTIGDALERMFRTNRAQLGVTMDGELFGVISHQDITRALHISGQIGQTDSVLNRAVTVAADRSYDSVRPDDELFVLFDALADTPYVIVEGPDTDPRVLRDVAFHQFLEGEIQEFLLIEEIERTLRERIRESLDDDLPEQLQATFGRHDLRTPDRLEDCSFRHYSILISTHWDAFDAQFDQRPDFVRELIDQVGEVRNRLFHFRDDDSSLPATNFLEFARDQLTQVADLDS